MPIFVDLKSFTNLIETEIIKKIKSFYIFI